ncbi:hypothetical protein HGP14_09415 [Rhizobium sp. P32RR-XVIII]|uniref:hypothetical protein n=1 Tax=Rhizobium sp. P32RR-XVIII TaxID=2726738 RepID=UPI00145640A8|nr:hypothetical protein [Rhizobium sp. P32RR-XVIII]NLS03575.1 hypothetical protein [Rhizobium sp. P32RR-XVIII]
MDHEIITQDGEIIESIGISSSVAVQLQKAEIDQLITTARAYPRSMKRVQNAIMSMATLDEESAEECMYALPRGGKPIKGPSIRFAEILKQSFGNCRAGARVVDVDRVEMFVEAEGVFHDLETNSSTTARVRRRISDKHGKLFKDDMIIVTGNAACSIAMRNAILAGVPKPLWRRAYETVQATITGDVTTLSENREKALKALAAFGVKPEQIFSALGREGIEDVNVDDIGTLRGMYSALKNGEATVEEMFFGTVKAASQHEKVADPLSDEPIKPQEAAGSDEMAPATENRAKTEAAADAELVDKDTNTESGVPLSPEAADAPSSASAEGGERSDPPSSPSTNSEAAGDTERDILIRYARDVLPMAADTNISPAALKEVEKQWAGDELKKLSEDGQEKARTISMSMRSIANGKTTLDMAIEYFSEVLGCEPVEIGGEA